MGNYNSSSTINTTATQLFKALTQEIPLWWTEMFEGSASEVGNSFTVRFGENVFKTIRIEELVSNSKVVWHIEDSLINIPELNNQKEWIGTTIVWKIEEKGNDVALKLTHIGLDHEIECYEICSNGWQQFTGSLKAYLETGSGAPYKINE
ncbi:hypothetical protein J2X31_001196 [Flavobacterium arsenatis]|uniref:Activator of Hsp90 ATPase homologue 1/2-like C-terminal domain-containing protein n=1 Tax=Flavobacterium arsenatis TaxID=1484332 RepID=A0ABU1TMJ5_9FLAO|nr:SRPBCC domain-containing protein [Flavobacterium arsenatis]MDR6967189.1 hypothetical protein [Flavobacterium arsenatis]